MIQPVVVDRTPGSFSLSQEGREILFEKARDVFFKRTAADAAFSVGDGPVPPVRLDGYEWSFDFWKIRSQEDPSDVWYFDSGFQSEDGKARTHSDLVRLARSGQEEGLVVAEVPPGVDWKLKAGESGVEWVQETARTWP